MNDTFLKQWNKLAKLSKNDSLKDLNLLFNDSQRVDDFNFNCGNIELDLSKNWIDQEVVDGLINLSVAAGLKEKIAALFSGKIINLSEQKPATHTAQRETKAMNQVMRDRQIMFNIADQYLSGKWPTAFGQKVEHVVNIGIGGSYLGPKLAVQALTELQTNNEVKIHFLPSVDDVALAALLKQLDIKRTLFCISSKSLGTIETIKNTETIIQILKQYDDYKPEGVKQSFVASTANVDKAKRFGIPQSHIMPFDPATGGRFSVWSSIGFPVLMAIGQKRFEEFLSGAQELDKHFQTSQLNENIPVLMALLSIWYRNFMHLSAYTVIPYDVRLQHLPDWLQQLMMESNGKMSDINGCALDYSTSPWLFGGHGQLSQHAFFQAFHQGKDVLPIDFIGVMDNDSEQQKFLLVNMLAQSAALMKGNNNDCIYEYCPGNRPSSVLLLKDMSARSLGQLLALYEHMIFVQSVIWNINCFDQPGVELGKSIAIEIAESLRTGQLSEMELDASTKRLIAKISGECDK